MRADQATSTTDAHDRLTLVRSAAAGYIAAGFAVCRIKAGEDKHPTPTGWPVNPATPERFLHGEGVGLICGPLSDGGHPGFSLLCVDGDHEDALKLGITLLPPTGMIDVRPGSGKAHFWYLVENASIPPEWVSACESAVTLTGRGLHPGPRVKHLTPVDVIGTGGMGCVPPTAHKSGVCREWYGGGRGEPARLTFPELLPRLVTFAEALGHEPRPNPRTGESRPLKERPTREGTSESADGGTDTNTTAVATPGPRRAATGCDLYLQAENRGAVTIDGRTYPFAERVLWAGRYIDRIPDRHLSRTEKAGHKVLFRVVRVLTNDLLIRDADALQELLGRYNARLRALRDEWSATELAHKVRSALVAAPRDEFPPGRKLGRRDELPRRWDDPARLAKEFVAGRNLRFLRDTAFEYTGGRYVVLSDEALTGDIRRHIDARAEADYLRQLADWRAGGAVHVQEEQDAAARFAAKCGNTEQDEARLTAARKAVERHERKRPKVVTPTTRAMVANTFDAVRARRQLPDTRRLNSWLSDGDRPPVIAVPNGLIDLTSGALLEPSADWFSLAALPVPYRPDAPPPAEFLAFLDTIMEGDAERIAVLQEMAGSCLDPSYPAKYFALLTGSGDNGKTVFLSALRHVLGAENCSAVNLRELGEDRFAAWGMYGKLANLIGDQGYFDSVCEGALKTATGGSDEMGFQRKGKDTLSAVNTAKIIASCNQAPTLSDLTNATWNRLVMVPFGYTVPAEKKNPAMLDPKYWRAEVSGILSWMVAGLLRLKAQRWFTKSERCEALKQRHHETSNPLDFYLRESFARGDGSVHTSEVVELCLSRMRADGHERKVTNNAVTARVKALFGLEPEKNSIRLNGNQRRGYVGLIRRDTGDGV